MGDLYLYGRRLRSVFELLGSTEDDISSSVGWIIAHCDRFRSRVVRAVLPKAHPAWEERVALQHWKRKKGRTDVEIFSPNAHIIIEAKRGWSLPGRKQLLTYARRLRASNSAQKTLLVVSECSKEYAARHLDRRVNGIRVTYLSWEDLYRLADAKESSRTANHILDELRTYLRRTVQMQDQRSNMVYVVAIGKDTPNWSRLSWREILHKKKKYFHPFGRDGWPKVPPNYIGFRYDGKLQSIHYVKSSKVVDDLHRDIPEIESRTWQKGYMLYNLGPAIIPQKEVKTGGVYMNGRVRAMLDLLLTSRTISEARHKTKARLRKIASELEID